MFEATCSNFSASVLEVWYYIFHVKRVSSKVSMAVNVGCKIKYEWWSHTQFGEFLKFSAGG